MKRFIAWSLVLTSLTLSASEKLTDANNDFGINLAGKVVQHDLKNKEIKNTLVSPISAFIALSMAANGAKGKTLQTLQEAINFSGTVKELNSQNSEVQKSLTTPQEVSEWQPKPPKVNVANSIWRTNGKTDRAKYKFSKEFSEALQSSYRAEVGVEDFKQKSAADAINGWVNKQTEGMIPKIIDQDALSEMLWVLINAVYIEANWAEPFYKVPTAGPNFTTAEGKKVKAQMMRNLEGYRHEKSATDEIIEVPLASSDLSFVIVMPSEDQDFLLIQRGVQDVAYVWQSSYWASVMNRLEKAGHERGTLVMPQFKFKYGFTLTANDPLTQALGLNPLFQDDADFSKMGTPDSLPSKVGLIKQNTAIEVDEKGLKAAAVTMIGGVRATAMPVEEFKMVVDRPFLFSIVDRKTGALLFLGSVVDPTAQ